jgi:hypothetical protein
VRLLGELEPDVVISSAFAGDAGVHEVDAQRWRELAGDALRVLTAP